MSLIPYGVGGSVVRVLREAAVTAADEGVRFDERPGSDTPYPNVVVEVGGSSDVEYTLSGHKTKVFSVTLTSYGLTLTAAETLGRLCETAMESIGTPAKLAAYTDALPDGVDVHDAGGETSGRERRTIGPNGERPYFHKTAWEITVRRLGNADRE